MAALQRIYACINNKIKAIKSKGQFNLTIKCDTPDEADTIEKTLAEKYGQQIEINDVQKIIPQVKITGVLCEETIDHQVLIATIKQQNHWLRESDFAIDRVYSINTKKGPYSNVIITCDISLQRKFIDQQYIIIGFREYVYLLECLRCYRFGHFARKCRFQETCRKCAEKHKVAKYTSNTSANKCSNCKIANTKGASYDICHPPTDDRCPSKIERIEALKVNFSKK